MLLVPLEWGPDVPLGVVFDCLFVERHVSRQGD